VILKQIEYIGRSGSVIAKEIHAGEAPEAALERAKETDARLTAEKGK
jgi:hypothetical protein